MRTLDAMLLFSYATRPVLSIPHIIAQPPRQPSVSFDPFFPLPHPPQPPRQVDPFSTLFIPTCALSCYLNAIPSDGCALEIDLRCHCSTGNILERVEACVEAACSENDREYATQKVVMACRAVGVNLRVPIPAVSSTLTSSSPRATPKEVAETTPQPTVITIKQTTDSAIPTTVPPPPPNEQPSEQPFSSSNETSSANETTASPTSEITSAPTDVAFVPTASNRSLSDGAKAGISVSVAVASAIFIALSLYIRRLKRQLAHAKAAADVPDSVLRSPSRRNTIPESLFISTRRQSWPTASRGRRLSRGDIPYASESPVSPLMPVFFRDSGGRRASISGVLRRERGKVLSVVLEREDDDASSLVSRRRFTVTEPVPGQSEGLVDPLELDGGLMGQIFEAPTSITPRDRSTEKQEWKDMFDAGVAPRGVPAAELRHAHGALAGLFVLRAQIEEAKIVAASVAGDLAVAHVVLSRME
ncbi:hypothetical protein BU23DRAFT_567774 [Bimuria novae-zelandiae CBS 107.79]|uniref:CFEM domain-containing protein n=1 Tax=Bimuria novae-zelandiae CBS 107.79 TaxID=1447943 RepID=A0A6A5VKP2_9PLEO|nr:hypothetical protein BU23DRAFT_567774 [Bimuria novae-zelandiae CBS 107.79]